MDNYLVKKGEIGLDEAGRGPLFGPVVAGCVIWDDKYNNIDGVELIMDSKKLSVKKRKLALEWIKKNVKYYGLGVVDNNIIDDINILEATKMAMNNALREMELKLEKDNNNKLNKKILVIDGCNWKDKDFVGYKVNSIIGGDNKILSIACASILAKEHHDELVVDIVNNNQDLYKYDLLKNKGYGTRKHIDAIKMYGYSDYHRKSFKIKV
ncbi:ribonuclease HII [Chlorella virus XW01]|nr:ribonuclease HII [Chlorella virus XW01]